MSDDPGLHAAREILLDSFGRVRELVEDMCSGLSPAEAAYRPAPTANSIGWLVWHLTRVQDDHLSGITGNEQVWTADGWHDRSGLSLPARDTGFGHSPDQVGQVNLDPALLDSYHAAVHEQTIAYVSGVYADELARVVDDRWDPPVTASVRLVSVIGDCLEHVGQAAYIRGMLPHHVR